MIYVPDVSYPCYSILDTNTIRAYHSQPSRPSTVDYTDYFINSHYISSEGSETFLTSSSLPVCISSLNLTNEVYYRNDFDSILIIFIILAFVCFYLPTRLVFKLFKKKGI